MWRFKKSTQITLTTKFQLSSIKLQNKEQNKKTPHVIKKGSVSLSRENTRKKLPGPCDSDTLKMTKNI